MDALTHAIEAYVSRKSNPFTDSVALTAMRTINRYIRTACNEPDNREAREAMMLAATLILILYLTIKWGGREALEKAL